MFRVIKQAEQCRVMPAHLLIVSCCVKSISSCDVSCCAVLAPLLHLVVPYCAVQIMECRVRREPCFRTVSAFFFFF